MCTILNFLSISPLLCEDTLIHESFDPIMSNKTQGGLIVSEMVLHIHTQNYLGLDLKLKPHAVNHINKLIDMINYLPAPKDDNQRDCDIQDTVFQGDRKLLQFLANTIYTDYEYCVDKSSPNLSPSNNYTLPLGRQMFTSPTHSGIYVFTHTESGNQYIGSALGFKQRLIGHIESLRDVSKQITSSHSTSQFHR